MDALGRLGGIARRVGFPALENQPLVERSELLHAWMVRFFSRACLANPKKSGLGGGRESDLEVILVTPPGYGNPLAPARQVAWRTRSVLEGSPVAGNDFPFAPQLLFCFAHQVQDSLASLGARERLPSDLSALARLLGVNRRSLPHLFGHLFHHGSSPVVRAPYRNHR